MRFVGEWRGTVGSSPCGSHGSGAGRKMIGIGESLMALPLPHHLAYPVEELFEVEINHDAVTFSDVALRLSDRLDGAPGPAKKAIHPAALERCRHADRIAQAEKIICCPSALMM
jgi:hypothetical protein